MPRVLLVSGCPAASARLCRLLRRWGYEALAVGGADALAAAAGSAPDVAVVDSAAPGLDALEFARQLRGLPGLRDCLLVAVADSPDGRRRAPEGDFDLCLPRPLNPEELRRLLVSLAVPPAGKARRAARTGDHQLLHAAG